jgi:hypothetical protein
LFLGFDSQSDKGKKKESEKEKSIEKIEKSSSESSLSSGFTTPPSEDNLEADTSPARTMKKKTFHKTSKRKPKDLNNLR